ncbi:MAG: ABC transporter ATP-binding protein [Pseudomonadota bacterium]
MGKIVLSDVNKAFGNTVVIPGINLTIEEGEFCVFVGPSGCGKSTLLRLIAGLEDTTSGHIEINGRDVTLEPPAKRGLAMVFQSYALYPHMTVAKNIGFPLKMARLDRAEADRRIKQAADILALTPYLDRRPGQLSGGQRQRVAIGRAIVREPAAFLFDEPLSNLDAALRVGMRTELTELHQQLKTTMIYVTHDQVEAMTMADKIVVLRAGIVEQVGSPLELYRAPANEFVAGFIGSPRMNILPGSSLGLDVAKAGIRPEHLDISRDPLDDKSVISGVAGVTEHLGSDTFVRVNLHNSAQVIARATGEFPVSAGDDVWLRPQADKLHQFDQNGLAVR